MLSITTKKLWKLYMVNGALNRSAFIQNTLSKVLMALVNFMLLNCLFFFCIHLPNHAFLVFFDLGSWQLQLWLDDDTMLLIGIVNGWL